MKDIEFKRGDFVKIKEGVKHPLLKIEISDWYGRVLEVEKESIEMELDSITLKGFSERTLKIYEERDEYPYLVTIPKDVLELSESRDTDEEVEKAQDELVKRIDSKTKDIPKYMELTRKWIRHFQRSEYYYGLSKDSKYNSDFIIENFSSYMYQYEDKFPKEWDVESATEVFLNWIPNKVTGDKELFKSYGEVLPVFFEFLESRKYLKTELLQELIEEVKDELVEISQDSSGWGIAKSLMMGAKEIGIDLDNQEEMRKYIQSQPLKRSKKIEEEEIKKKGYGKLGRNQKVTVKYEDGTILEDVKFKKIQEDLLKGKCKVIKK